MTVSDTVHENISESRYLGECFLRKEKDGGPGENRTPTPLRALDFESSASTNSTTRPAEALKCTYELSPFQEIFHCDADFFNLDDEFLNRIGG